ncbi:MAG TPA: chemotaxis protein CheB, partial [Gemmataceae bacterium]
MSEPRGDFYVVGVGASAGGLEALEQLFSHMPEGAGAAFVVVQHLSPDFESHLDQLLRRQTRIPVRRAEDGMRVEPNAIYLIPPKKEMIIAGGKLLLTDKDPQRGLTLPIDHFFRSLAQDARRHAIGIILSGTGSDGSRGVRDVREAGGLVICQDPATAKFDGMPRSALETGAVDLVLPPAAVPGALVKYIEKSMSVEMIKEEEELAAVSDHGMGVIFQLLRSSYGIDFTSYKPNTVARRVRRRLALGHSQDLEEYAERLRHDPAELNALYRDLLIGVTRFFRDREAYARLEAEAVPELLRRGAAEGGLRVWVAGCATGEEAYSLGILLHEQAQRAGLDFPVKIFATDVHRASLETASVGAYPEEALTEPTPERRARYFRKKADGYHVAKEVRQMIVFAPHNVLTDAPFTRLDLISCRNLLIYLRPMAQKKVLSLFHFGLRTGGYLFLGPSETPGDLADEFDPVDAHWKLYRKRRDVRLSMDLRLPAPAGAALPGRRPAGGGEPRADTDGSLLATYDLLLNRFMPTAILVDETFRLVHTFGGAERFLRLRGGRPSTNVLDMVDEDLRTALSGA